MKDRILRIATALLGAAAATSAQQGDAPTTSVRSLLPFALPSLQRGDAVTTALPDDRRGDAPFGLSAGGYAEPPTWLLPLLEQRHRDAIDAGRLRLSMVGDDGKRTGERLGDRLLLNGRRSDVDACNRELDMIAAQIGRPIEVTAWQLPLPDGPLPSTTWTAARLQQAMQQTTPLWTVRGRTRSGGALRLASERGRSHLRDIDVEVAEKSHISDPKLDVVFAGARATLVAHALPGDELVLSGSWLLSEPVAMHEQPIGSGPNSETVDLPEHRTAMATFAGRIGSGGALVVAGRGGPVGPDGFLLVVAARYLSPPPGEVAPDLLVRPVTALLQWPMLRRPQLEWRRPGQDEDPFPAQQVGLTRSDLEALLPLRPDAEVTVTNQLVVVSGNAEACRLVDTMLQQQTAAIRPAAWQVRATAAGGKPLELVQPILNDRAAAAFVGRERAVVHDFEVEIAARAAAANPVIGIARSGLWFGATTTAIGAGHHVTGSWSLAAFDAPQVRVHAAAVPLLVQLVDYRLAALPWDAAMATNQEHLLGNGPPWERDGPPTTVSVTLIAP